MGNSLDDSGARELAEETGVLEGSGALDVAAGEFVDESDGVVSEEVGACVEAGADVAWLLGTLAAVALLPPPSLCRLTSSAMVEARPWPRASWPWMRWAAPRHGPAFLARERPNPTKRPTMMATASRRMAVIFRGVGCC